MCTVNLFETADSKNFKSKFKFLSPPQVELSLTQTDAQSVLVSIPIIVGTIPLIVSRSRSVGNLCSSSNMLLTQDQQSLFCCQHCRISNNGPPMAQFSSRDLLYFTLRARRHHSARRRRLSPFVFDSRKFCD